MKSRDGGEVVRAAADRLGERAAKRAGGEDDVGVGEQQPVGVGAGGGGVEGVVLAEPAGRQLAHVLDPQPPVLRRQRVEDRPRAVGRAVVDGDHLQPWVVLRKHRPRRLLDAGRLVARREDDGQLRPPAGRRVVRQVRQPRDAAAVARERDDVPHAEQRHDRTQVREARAGQLEGGHVSGDHTDGNWFVAVPNWSRLDPALCSAGRLPVAGCRLPVARRQTPL